MSLYVRCVTLCLLVGKYSVSPCCSGVQIAPGAVIREGSIIRGDVTIGQGTVVQARARILADAGPIVIGRGNVIEQAASIINRGGSYAGETQIIGNGNVFQTESSCEALRVGDGNVLQTKAIVGPGIEMMDGCVIVSFCSISGTRTLPRGTVVHGAQCQSRNE